MKSFLTLALAFASAVAHCDELRLDDLGLKFNPKSTDFVWKLSTNRVPRSLNIYRVGVAQFSQETISNLLTLGKFKDSAAAKKALLPALEGKDCSFEEEPAHKSISILPSRGVASFFNDRVIPLPGQTETAPPSDEQVLHLALNIAKTLGIKDSELARKPDSREYLVWRDKRTRGGLLNGKYAHRDIARGIYLYRAVNGISFEGHGLCGGLYVNFGNNGNIAELNLSWRRLEAVTAKATAHPQALTKKLKTGNAVIQISEDANLEKIQTLTITNILAHYRGYASNERQAWVYPFAILEATAELGSRKLPASLLCPILKE